MILKSSSSILGYTHFPFFWNAGCENCFRFEQDHPEFPFQEKGQSGGTESPKRGSVSTRKTDRLHDLRQLSSDWRSRYRYWLRWFTFCYSPWWQHSGIRYKMGRSSIVDVKNSIRWYLGKSVQIEDTWVWTTQNRITIVRHGNSQKISMPNYQVENHGEEKYRSETSIAKFRRQKWEDWDRSSGYESQGIKWQRKRKRNLLSVERERAVFERRPMQFLARE